MNPKAINQPLSRRNALIGTAALGASTVFTPPFIRKSMAADPLRIGMIFPKSGSQSLLGQDMARGAQYQLENLGSKVLNQNVELVWLDEPDPQTAQQNAQKLVAEQKVAALFGGGNSATGLAIESVAKRTKTPYFAINPAARQVTGENCNPYTFRLCATIPVCCRALAPFLEKTGKKWYMLTASYAFGQDISSTVVEIAKESGSTIVGNDQTPLGTTDFSSFILKIRQSNPDLVVLGTPATDLTNFIKQFEEYGLKGKIPIAVAVISDPDIWALGASSVANVIGGKQWYFADPNNPADEKAFVDGYRKKYDAPPSDKSWLGWYGMKMLSMGIQNAGSTEPGKIVQAIEGLKLPDGQYFGTVRRWDHQVLHRLLVVKIKDKPTDKYDVFDIISQSPGKEADMDAMFGSPQEIGCKMEAL